MLIFMLCLITWMFVGSLICNLLWVARDIESNPDKHTSDEYSRGVVFAIMIGPFALTFLWKQVKKLYELDKKDGYIK